MPQPDNKRTRGSNLNPLAGRTVAPEGTSGVYNISGVASNIAAKQKMSSLQIGQQGRIIDDGSGLYKALQGGFEGIERGVKQYDYWEGRVAEKRQNDFETDLYEYSRMVNGDPKKMAEWSRLNEYRPNHRQAKRYNSMMAEMEGKEYDAYQDDIIRQTEQTVSTMDLPLAAEYYSQQMKSLDPTDKAYASFARSQNEINKRMTALSKSYTQTNQKEGYQVGMFNLGEQLLANNAATPAELATERAQVIAQAHNFFGQSSDRLVIDPKTGGITYTDSGGQVYNSSFKGGLQGNIIAAIQRDLGNVAYKDNGDFDPQIAENVMIAMAEGKFNGMHTSRSSAAISPTEQLDAARHVMSDPNASQEKLRGAAIAAMSSAHTAVDKKARHALDAATTLVDSSITSDMSPQEKITSLTNLLSVIDPDENPLVWTENGFEGNIENNPDVNKLIAKARDEIATQSVVLSKDVATRYEATAQKSSSSQEIRDARKASALEIFRNMAVVSDGGATMVFPDGEGGFTRVFGQQNIQQYLVEHPDAIASGMIQVVRNVETEDIADMPGVFYGRAGADPPEATQQWSAAQRQNMLDVQNVEAVRTAVANRKSDGVTAADASRAVTTLMSKLPSEPQASDVAPSLEIMSSGLWPRETTQAMYQSLMDNSKGGSGQRLQQVFGMTSEEAWNFAVLSPEMLTAALNSDDPDVREEAIKFDSIARLARQPETAEAAMFLIGDPNGDAAWFMTTGRTYVDQFVERYGEAPNTEWLRTAKSFEALPSMAQRSREITTTIANFARSGDIGQTNNLLEKMLDPANQEVEVMVARTLQSRWASTNPGEGNSFVEIISDANHPHKEHLTRWMNRGTRRMLSADAITKMTNTAEYNAYADDRKQALADRQDMPELSEDHFAAMWQAATRAFLPATGGLMSPENANVSTIPLSSEYGGEQMDTSRQAAVHGLRFVAEALLNKVDGAQQGDTSTVLENLGIPRLPFNTETNDEIINSYMIKPSMGYTVFKAFHKGAPSQCKRDFEAWESAVKTVFTPDTDFGANDNAQDGSAYFNVKINAPEGELLPEVRRMLDEPTDNPNSPLLKFRRVPPVQNKGGKNQYVELAPGLSEEMSPSLGKALKADQEKIDRKRAEMSMSYWGS